MVDFNAESTVSTPAGDIERVLILQRRADLMEAIEDYLKKEAQGYAQLINIVRSRLFTLFLQVSGMLHRKNPKAYETMKREIRGLDDIEKVIEVTLEFNDLLDDLGLTRIDTRTRYDKTRVEIENKEKGL